ncbi:hypothetical protein CKO29_11030 [Allochromatium vinosum]|nr:hypothetical protein [Allochromatium vinosum]
MPESPPTDWRSVPALAEIINRGSPRPTLSVHAIRHYARNAASNGLAPHVRRLGRKVLISESGFFAWLNEQQAA